jgi:hypothetical protein
MFTKHLARPGAMVSLSHFFLELIKHKVIYLISALSMVSDCHFNLFCFYHFARKEKQAMRTRFWARVHAQIWLNLVWLVA